MVVIDAATEEYLTNHPEEAAVFDMTPEDVQEQAASPELIYMRFYDQTIWAVYPTSLGFPETFAHVLLQEFVDNGGTILQ